MVVCWADLLWWSGVAVAVRSDGLVLVVWSHTMVWVGSSVDLVWGRI